MKSCNSIYKSDRDIQRGVLIGFTYKRQPDDLTKRVDFELDYNLIAADQQSGGLTHHAAATIEIDITRRFDLDVSFIWEHISHPQADSIGVVPLQNDFRLTLSLGLKF